MTETVYTVADGLTEVVVRTSDAPPVDPPEDPIEDPVDDPGSPDDDDIPSEPPPNVTAGGLWASRFGVVGDGETDDTAAFQRALTAAEKQAAPLLFSGIVRVTAPLAMTTTQTHKRPWGLIGIGGVIQSEIGGGKPVLTIDSSKHFARFFKAKGFTIAGSGDDGDGLVLRSVEGSGALYRFVIDDITVTRCGGHGIAIYSDVFEGRVTNCFFSQNGGNGAMQTNALRGGHVSSIDWIGCQFDNSGGHGFYSDVGRNKIIGGDFVANRKAAVWLERNNPGSHIVGTHNENNWRGAGFSADHAHIHVESGRVVLRSVEAITMPVKPKTGAAHGGTVYLVIAHATGGALIEDCAHIESSPQPQGGLRLGKFTAGQVHKTLCNGRIDLSGGAEVVG